MRGKKTAINTAMSLLQEFCAVICGFVVPKMILTAFGSKYNGLTTSITQFLTCSILLRSGIGGATRAALYKPLAEKNQQEINGIMRATDLFMKRIGLILGASITVFAAVYPFLVSSEFDWMFTFTLFLIIGAGTFAESFFGITYLILLQADQRLWVSSLMKAVCYILNTVFSTLLIRGGAGIHIVKLGSAAVYVIYPIFLNFYVRKRYRIDTHVESDNRAVVQRWDAFWHQTANFVMNNTDVMVLTVFTNMLVVSVYSVYSLVINGLNKLVIAFSSGLEAAFGNMIAKEEDRALRENLSLIEWVLYSISTVVFTCALLTILSFVNIYTKGITDTDYSQPVFAYILLAAQFFNGVRVPYQMIVQAAGHYRQTRNGAILEPLLNVGISVALVIRFGLIGVAVGTLTATVFRTAQYSWYTCRHLVHRSQWITVFRFAVSFLEGAITVILVRCIPFLEPHGYLSWAVNAIVVCFISGAVVILISLIFFRKDFRNFLIKVRRIFR